MRITGRTGLLVLLVLLTAEVDEVSAAVKVQCPFARQRPPLAILRLPPEERPPLCMANLRGADLSRASLQGANLSEAYLGVADLSGAYLVEANLSGADLGEANLSGANLLDANLSGAYLERADLGEANLSGANLSRANLSRAGLSRASLGRANLSGAYLVEANLSGADLGEANLSGANLGGADLSLTMFEPQYQSLSSVVGVEFARHIELLRYELSPAALVALRERFAKAGFRAQERRVTFAKLRSQQHIEWKYGSLRQRIEAGFSYLAFDLPCRYGLDYGRPLRTLGGLIPAFAVVYAFALRGHGRGGIWRVWQPDRIQKDEGQPEPERLRWEPLEWTGSRPSRALRFCRAVGLGLLFSLVSAFQIGFREFTVGNWITRLQPREYTLRATGWVRVVSGVQSLLSVYLLALWVLTYFGRPFE